LSQECQVCVTVWSALPAWHLSIDLQVVVRRFDIVLAKPAVEFPILYFSNRNGLFVYIQTSATAVY
jgi:hypothetical protein